MSEGVGKIEAKVEPTEFVWAAVSWKEGSSGRLWVRGEGGERLGAAEARL
jgi:hypothetical protein